MSKVNQLHKRFALMTLHINSLDPVELESDSYCKLVSK